MILDFKNSDYIDCVEGVKSAVRDRGYFAYVHTFGCQQNEADSEKIRGMLIEMGYSLSNEYEKCDLIIVNTCAIRELAEKKAFSMLGLFGALKKKRPELIVGVVGCMAAESGTMEKLKRDFHYVSFTAEPNMLHKIPYLILKYLNENKRSFVIGEDKGDLIEGIPTYRCGNHRAWVSIMYGCNNFCSYCIVPYVRGRERSRRSEDVIRECRELIDAGVKEITLLGQNVNSYKADIDFPSLLESIAKIDGEFVIRFMTSHPKDVSPNLVEVMKKHRTKIAPFFHLPLQSGSDKILKSMNRTYDRERYLSVVEMLRGSIPDIVLSTDVIVGFPGEQEEDFEDTLDILRKVEFDSVFCFAYSPRAGTKAEKMTDTVPDEIKTSRMGKLFALQDKISYEKNLSYVGRIERVLVDSVSKNDQTVYSARTLGNKLVHFKSSDVKIGEFAEVEIEKAGVCDLFAKIKK